MVRKPAVRRSPSPSKLSLPADGRRRSPLIAMDPVKPSASLAEAAGATAAGCAALCCCIPCGLLHLLLVIAIKVPVGLLRRALRRRRRKRRERAEARIWKPKAGAFREDSDLGLYDGDLMAWSSSEETWPANSPSREIAELEREMLARFQDAGFWRSLSRGSERQHKPSQLQSLPVKQEKDRFQILFSPGKSHNL